MNEPWDSLLFLCPRASPENSCSAKPLMEFAGPSIEPDPSHCTTTLGYPRFEWPEELRGQSERRGPPPCHNHLDRRFFDRTCS